MKKRIPTSVLYVIAGCLAAIWIVIGFLWSQESRSTQTFADMVSVTNETDTSSLDINTNSTMTNASQTEDEMPAVVLEEVNDKTVNIKIYADDVVESLNSFNDISLSFDVPGIKYETRSLCEVVFLKFSDDSVQIHANYWETEDSINESISIDSLSQNLIIEDNAICFRAVSEEFLSYIKQCPTYRLYYNDDDDELKEFFGQVEDAFSFGKEHSHTQLAGTLPAEFATLEEDNEFFTPKTDLFKIVEITIYKASFPAIGYFLDSNSLEYVYGADLNNYEYSENPVILTYLISYDEFGPVDAKVKIEYASEEERNKITFCKKISLVELTGSQEYDAEAISKVLPDLIRESDDYYINEYFNFSCSPDVPHISLADRGITYLGPHGNARYFTYELEGDYRKDGGSLVVVPGVSYNEPEISADKINRKFEFKANEIVDNGEDRFGYPVRTYSSFEE